MSKLFDYLRSTYALSDPLVQHLASVVKTKTFPKKSFLLSAGVVRQHLYFYRHGARQVFLPEGWSRSFILVHAGDRLYYLRT